MQTQATHKWFEDNNKRSMIVSRSSFAGHGKFGAKWHGYSESTLDYLDYSILDVMMQNVNGIPLAGSDVCGFSGDADDDLCTRWYNIAAFHPFALNNRGRTAANQEPYVFQNRTLVAPTIRYIDLIRNSMKTKYALLNYYYTEISMLHEEGGTFYRPLFFDFPNDPDAYANKTHNIMLGQHLKLSH